jgi:uncharacterized protein YdaT
MKEQKFLITSNKRDEAIKEVNSLLEEGWLITTIVPRAVSSTSAGYSGTQHGAFEILFEREKK